ncbi:MAG: sugar ABC transporter permease [Acidothermus sp.]|nr:sugar ABC transporter permease [Acidothermus sp.]MCL6538590.1 sugar ABC transporter permease [Acidothermus sp.]
MTAVREAHAGVLAGTVGHPRKRRPRYALIGSKAAYLYVAPFFVVFAIFGLYPLLYTGWISLHDVSLLNINKMTWVGFHNYTSLWTNHFFLNALTNTITIGIISAVPQLLMALGIAHLLNYRMKGSIAFRIAMLMPYATSVVATTLIFGELYSRDFGFVNWFLHFFGVEPINWVNAPKWQSQLAVASIVIWRWTGYNALIYLAGMQAIPHELYEAAAIDGANRWQQFRKITIPSLRPTILFTVVVSTIGSMQMFAEPYLFGSGTNGGGNGQYQTLTLYLYQQGWQYNHLGFAAAVAWTMLVVCLVLVIINAMLTNARGRRG